MCNICVLHEMLVIRTGTKKCDNFSLEEVQIITEDIIYLKYFTPFYPFSIHRLLFLHAIIVMC